MPEDLTKQFNVSNLQQLDRGKIAAAVNHHIRQCVDDVAQRCGEKAKRSVTLKIDFTPIIDKDTGTLDTVGVAFNVKATIPVQKSTIYPMLPAKGGTLVFQPGSPADPRQQVMGFMAGDQVAADEELDKETGEVKKKKA